MGIKGLTNYLKDREHRYFENYKLHDCNLVIDGHSTSCELFNWNHRRLDARSNICYGGDYDKYAYIVENFLRMLKEVKVKPIVIFDGGIEQRKLSTMLRRKTDRIKTANKVNPSSERKNHKVVYPLFLRETFKDILKKFDIQMVMCQYEGDIEIASIAKVLDCPVLTFDSDYCLFGAKYIPFKTLDHKVRSVKNKRKFISCKIYKNEKILEDFHGLQETSLPLLPVLMGNDYIKPLTFQKFMKSLNLLEVDNQTKIEGILTWLKGETTETAIKKILKNCNNTKQRQDIFKKIKKIMSGYHYVESSLLDHLNITPKNNFKQENFDFKAIEEELSKESDTDIDSCIKNDDSSPRNVDQNDVGSIENSDNEEITKWSNSSPEKSPDNNSKGESDELDKKELQKADLNSENKLTENWNTEENIEAAEVSLEDNSKIEEDGDESEILDMEDCYLDNKNDPTNPISKLFLRNFTNCQYPSSFMDILTQNKFYCIPQIENHAQEHSHIFILDVLRAIHKILTGGAGANFTVIARGAGITSMEWFTQDEYKLPVPTLEEIEHLSLQGRRETLLRILNIEENFMSVLEHFPIEWHTFLLSLEYAMTKKTFETHLIYSLFLCFIILNYIDNKIGYYRSMKRYQEKYSRFMNIPPQTNRQYFSQKDCVIFMYKVVDFFTLNPKENAESFDKDLVHSMAQIQSVLLHIKYLNSLLQNPYPNLLINQIFNGTFIYNMTKTLDMKSSELQNSYLNVLFKDCPTILEALKYLLKCVE